jgi:3'5'-cyclic nucleotide phosphodiesterase
MQKASHVTMSVVKLLSRISSDDDVNGESSVAARSLHHLGTYGITSDPLACFGCVFSALVHDVDHPGIPNAQLVAENSRLCQLYKGKSVAEQNSVDIAWNMLMEERFDNFRTAIFDNDEDQARFRQIVVNSVMATDIMDRDLKKLRDSRWNKAFDSIDHGRKCVERDIDVILNRKATIVIEHLIQASDVSGHVNMGCTCTASLLPYR